MNRRHLTVLLTLIAVLSSGCGRHIDSRDPVRSLPESGPIPFDVTVEINDRSVGLSWRVNDTTDVAKYRIYVGEADGTFVLRDSSTTTRATLDGLPLNRVHLFAVSAVSTTGLEWDRSNPASGTVIPLSITIENDDEFSNNRSVFVQLHVGTATTHLSLSEDSSRLDESFVQFTGTQTPFTLSDGDGPKRVYARVIFSDGARSGLPLYDDVILDRRAEIGSTSFSPLSTVFSEGDTILFSVDCGENGGQASVTIPGFGVVDLFDDGSSPGDVVDDGIYVRQWVVPPGFNLSNGRVDGMFTDAAGNVAATVMASQTLSIFSAPSPVTVSAITRSSWEIDLSWTDATTMQFAAYRVYRSLTPSVDTTSDLVRTIAVQTTTTFTDTTLDDDKTYYYTVYVYDDVGLSAGSNVVSAHTLLNFAPLSVELVALNEPDSSMATLNWTPSQEMDFESYRIYRSISSIPDNPTSGLVSIVRNRMTTSANVGLPIPGATYNLRVFVFDRQGLRTGSNQQTVTRPPDSP